MLELDIEQFWKDEAAAHEENCFSKAAPQVALGIRMSDECVFAELGEEGQPWGYTPPERRYELNCRYNEKARKIVGRALLAENKPVPPEQRPKVTIPGYKQIGEVFGGQYVFDGNTTWLKGSISDNEGLEKKLDEIDVLTGDPEKFRAFVLPPDWDERCRAVYELYGRRPGQFTGIRGPVTLATSVFGIENLLFLYYDDPELFTRFADTIGDVVLAYVDLFIRESGNDESNFRHGFSFADDDSNLMTPEMYKSFGYRVLKRVFDKTAPLPEDSRYQHSDSAMGHLIPLLADFNLTGCNFGPTVTVQEIRKYMPKTRIDGQLAPFTFMRNNEDDIIAEVKRDCEAARENDARGLNLTTAGSINNGSLLTSMRTVMAAIQNFGRY
ncbi:MAG: uroporphyrinogen decarboxylase family protein [Eubacteriales bacterium]